MRRWILVSAALVMAGSGTAYAQRSPAVAEVRLDVNADGRPDVVRIENPAAVSVSITGKKKAGLWKPLSRAGKVTGGEITVGRGSQYPGGLVIVAEAAFGRGPTAPHEAVVLSWRKGRVVELWRGAVGARGPDREWSEHVATSDHGLLFYQGKPGVTRCDDQPVYAFLQRWDDRSGAFRPVKGNLVRVDPAAPTLTATRVTASPAPPQVFRRAAASSIPGARSARELVPPHELIDGRVDTAWRVGSGGHGRGEVITFRSAVGGSKVAALRFVPGDAVSKASFARQNRLRAFAVLVGKRAHWISIDTDPAGDPDRFAELYEVRFDPPIETDCVSVVLDDVYPEANPGQTAIAEMAVLTEAELTPGGLYAALAEQVAAGGLRGDSAAKTLARGGSDAARALIAELGKPGRVASERERLLLAMARIEDPVVVGELVTGLGRAGVSDDTRARLAAAVAGFGSAAVAPLAALIGDAATEPGALIAAAGALGSIGDDGAVRALAAAAGHPNKLVRRAIGVALGRHGARVPLLLEVARDDDELRRAAAWRALGAIAAREPSARATIVAAMAEALARGGGYELRYRLYDAAGAIEDTALTAALDRALAAETVPALVRVAAGSLAQNPGADAAGALARLLGHADPGVRGRAARALAERDHAASDAALVALLGGDRWPEVRLSAATALAQRCSRPAPARALADAVDRDESGRVRLSSLVALVACDAPGIAARLVAIAGDRKRDPELRARACLLYGTPGDGTRAAALLELFGAARNEALGGGSAALPVAAACATALGHTRHASATTALLGAAGDTAFPDIQAAAATALGLYCPAEARSVLADLRASPQRQVSIAAKSAYRRCFR